MRTTCMLMCSVISVMVPILTCANLRSVIESNPRYPFSERRGLRQLDGRSSLVYFKPKHENQHVSFQTITGHSSDFQTLHSSPWDPARILHESQFADIEHPISEEILPRITSQVHGNFGSSFQHNDDLFKSRFLPDASISSEDNLKDSYSEYLSEENRRSASNENWISLALDQASFKLETLFDENEEESERCVQEALWDRYGEYLKRRFKDCDFFLEDDRFRWRRYITRIQTCGKGWRRVKRSCRAVFTNRD